MQTVLEMTASPAYTGRAVRRLRLLKLLRVALAACLIMSWIYGIAVTVAFLQEFDGRATQWLLFFSMFTIPATALLVMVCLALHRFNREYDYLLQDDLLEIFISNGHNRRKLLTQINCHSIVAFAPIAQAKPHPGRSIRAVAGSAQAWALDVRHEGRIVRVLLQPDEIFRRKLAAYVK